MPDHSFISYIRALGRRDGMVLWAIVRLEGNPTNLQIARLAGYSERTIQRAIKSLVEQGYLLRSLRGSRRRLAPAPGLVVRRKFDLSPQDIDYLSGIYGEERVSHVIRVLEATYALSRKKPRCPVAVVKAVLKRGVLHYPPGYTPRQKLGISQRAILGFDNLSRPERERRIRRAYARIFARTGDHAQAVARAEREAIWEMAVALEKEEKKTPAGKRDQAGTERPVARPGPGGL